MVSRKRAREEMEETTDVLHEPSLLDKLRNMWEFSCLMQYIFIFGKAVKIEEDFDIEVLHSSSSHLLSTRHQTRGAQSPKPFSDDVMHSGPRDRMLNAWSIRETCRDRPLPSQIRLIASRLDVRSIS